MLPNLIFVRNFFNYIREILSVKFMSSKIECAYLNLTYKNPTYLPVTSLLIHQTQFRFQRSVLLEKTQNKANLNALVKKRIWHSDANSFYYMTNIKLSYMGANEQPKLNVRIWQFPFNYNIQLAFDVQQVWGKNKQNLCFRSTTLDYFACFYNMVFRKSRQNIVVSWACELHDFRMFTKKKKTGYNLTGLKPRLPRPFPKTQMAWTGARASRLSPKETFQFKYTLTTLFSNSFFYVSCLSVVYIPLFTLLNGKQSRKNRKKKFQLVK